jgi:hypothetical protein
MGWRDVLKGVVKGPDWRGWAEQHGFTFTEEAPELVGKWLPQFDGTNEHYTDVVDGRWRTLDFQV